MNEFEIDKERFGRFLAEERKGKGLTQKGLAERLYVSDKAVSKWERGLSLPDVTLLIPLGKVLGVTVTELLEGRRLDAGAGMEMAEVEHLVKKTLSLSAETPEQRRAGRRKRLLLWAACLAAALAELGCLAWLGKGELFLRGEYLSLELLAAIFSAWLWLGAKERLPDFYDQNSISFYTDGIFRISLPGVSFNNRSWPCLLAWLRLWSVSALIAVPLLALLAQYLPWPFAGGIVVSLLFLATLFLPLWALARAAG